MGLSTNAIIIIISSITCGLIIVGIVALIVFAKKKRPSRAGGNEYVLVNSEVEMFKKK